MTTHSETTNVRNLVVLRLTVDRTEPIHPCGMRAGDVWVTGFLTALIHVWFVRAAHIGSKSEKSLEGAWTGTTYNTDGDAGGSAVLIIDGGVGSLYNGSGLHEFSSYVYYDEGFLIAQIDSQTSHILTCAFGSAGNPVCSFSGGSTNPWLYYYEFTAQVLAEGLSTADHICTALGNEGRGGGGGGY